MFIFFSYYKLANERSSKQDNRDGKFKYLTFWQ